LVGHPKNPRPHQGVCGRHGTEDQGGGLDLAPPLADRFVLEVALIDYGPVLLRIPFGSRLAAGTLSSEAPRAVACDPRRTSRVLGWHRGKRLHKRKRNEKQCSGSSRTAG